MAPEDVRKHEMLIAQKKSMRSKAENKKKSASEKLLQGDIVGAKRDLMDARHLIQEALKRVRMLGERGMSERTIQDDIEVLWREISEKK